jgi:hypothetical protein
MTAYELALFAHLVGVVTLFAAIALVQTAGARLRRAAKVQHVRLWVDLTRTAAPLFPVALLTVLASGLFMAADFWSFTTPWVVVAIAGVIVMGGIGGSVQGRYFAAIGRTARATEDGPVPQSLSELIAAPALWVSVAAPDVGTLGILWTMAIKPGWTGSIVAVAGMAMLGAIVGYILSNRRRQSTITAHSADPRNPIPP